MERLITCTNGFASMITKSLRKPGGRLSGPAAFLRLSFFNLTITQSSKIEGKTIIRSSKTKPGPLPKFQNEQCNPFEAVGADYTGLIYYRSKSKTKLKSWILLFPCNVSIMIYLELVPDLTTQVFIEGLKKLIARYRSPKTICSENAKTFKTGTLRPRRINNEDKFHCFLCNEIIAWKFNLLIAP